ncbi:MAG: hypothetical protein IPJ67_05330 [Candidatus Moraniibacteriota bacterium]|nr:MAG: hypothetical protein IPJ67_05330 [Candidatus Moranbacteria bacterium]
MTNFEIQSFKFLLKFEIYHLKFAIIIFLASILLFSPKISLAQTTPFEVAAEGLTLSPPSFEMTLKPGEETAHTIQITNPTKNLIELYPSAGNFTSSGDGGEPKYEIGTTALESSSRFSIANWVSFYTPKVAILPEQVVEFRFRIKVPDDAEPGGHYGVVFLGTKPPEDKDQEAQVALSTMVGSLLLVRIPGDIREEMRVEEFSAPWFFWTPPVAFTLFLRNTGTVHTRPSGDIAIADWRGHTVERLDINPKKGSVLPESRRKFDTMWKPDIAHFWNIPIGKFHATFKATYGQKSQEVSQYIAFWIIPKWLVITVGTFLGLLILIIIFLIIRRKRKKKQSLPPVSPPSTPRPLPPLQPANTIPLDKPLYPSTPISPIQPSIPPSSPSPLRPMSPVQPTPSVSPLSTPSTPPSHPTQKPNWMNRISESNEVTKTVKKNMRF